MKNSRYALALLIGASAVNGSLTDQLQLPQQSASEEDLIDAARQNREDLKATRAQIEASVNLLREAWSQYFPSVSLNFQYFLSRQSFPSEVDWTSTLQFNFPVFSAGLIHEDVRTAWSLLRQSLLAHSYLQRQIEQQVKTALENLQNMKTQVHDIKVQVEAARQFKQRADYAYNAGTAVNLDRLIAENQLLQARLDLTQAEMAEKVFYLDLLREIGQFNTQALQDGSAFEVKSVAVRSPAEEMIRPQ